MALASLTGCSGKVSFASTPRPSRMGWRNIAAKFACRSFLWGAQAASLHPSAACRRKFFQEFFGLAAEASRLAGLRSPELKLPNRCPNIIHRYVARNVRFTDFRRDHKSNFAGGKFFIVRNRVDDFLAIDLGRQLRRQAKFLEQSDYLVPLVCGERGPFLRNGAGRNHPNTDAIAVRNPKIRGALDSVPYCVTKIQ